MHFDEKAQDWDKDPKKNERARIFAEEIDHYIKPNKKLTAFEFGCGTGLLSFHLKDAFKQIALADNSEGMIEVLKDKILKAGINHFKPLKIDVFDDGLKLPKYDVLYTLMTLHHMLDLNRTLTKFHSLLNPNGYLCIADLVKEDGSFHAQHKDFVGHNGFDKHELSELLLKNGFKMEYYKVCFEIEKKVDDTIKRYPLFLMICKKIN